MDYTRLKVVELKELLTTRGLSTKGVKADLIARLEESDAVSIIPQAETPAAKSQEEGPQEDEVEILPSFEVTNVTPDLNTAHAEESEASSRDANRGELVAESTSPLPAEPLSATSDLTGKTGEGQGAMEVVEEQAVTSNGGDEVKEIAKEIAKEASPAVASLSSRLVAQEEPSSSEGGPSALQATASSPSEGVEAILHGHISDTNADDAPTSSSVNKSNKTKGPVPLSSLLPPHPPTRALRLTGLVRPMMLSALREMLQDKFGHLDDRESVKGGVWLDGIKSSGWIVFKEDGPAQELCEAFNRKPFPSADTFRTPVAFFYVPPALVPRLIQEEEDYWEKERGRMEVVATFSRTQDGDDGEGDGSYEYSTRPLKQQKKIRDPKPPPTSATAAAQTIVGGSGQGLSIRGSGGFNKRAGLTGAANGHTVDDMPTDASVLPPVSFPPDRFSREEPPQHPRIDGRGRGGGSTGRGEARYQPYPHHHPPSSSRDQDRPVAAAPPDYPRTAASPSGPLRDVQTELELSRSRDAAASAYAGRGGRSDSRRENHYGGVGRGAEGNNWQPSSRGYDRGSGSGSRGYGYRDDYDRHEEPRNWDRRRAYDQRDLPIHAPAPAIGLAARDDRSRSTLINGGAGGEYRSRETGRGASPGWMGDRPPAGSASDRDLHRERGERERYDRPLSVSHRGGSERAGDTHRDGGGGGGSSGREGDRRGKDKRERERSPRVPGDGEGQEDRYPGMRNGRD